MSAREPRGMNIRLHIWRQGTAYETRKALSFQDEWTNLRFCVVPARPLHGVLNRDLRDPLPYPDATFEAVYARHVLEHMTPPEGLRFLGEVGRILAPGGVCRISVPDLETKCIEYLERLREARADPIPERLRRHRWAVLDLIDQMVRQVPGGEMLEVLRRGDFDQEQLSKTTGDVFTPFFPGGEWSAPPPRRKLSTRVREKTFAELRAGVASRAWRALGAVDALLRGSDPRRSREATFWMYDELYLRSALETAGFAGVRRRDYNDSAIANWARYDFDRSSSGEGPLEPSLVMECFGGVK